jgi:hypothetical protein
MVVMSSGFLGAAPVRPWSDPPWLGRFTGDVLHGWDGVARPNLRRNTTVTSGPQLHRLGHAGSRFGRRARKGKIAVDPVVGDLSFSIYDRSFDSQTLIDRTHPRSGVAREHPR